MERAPGRPPCSSSSQPRTLLWDWDAEEEGREAKRGKQQQQQVEEGEREGEARCQVEGCGVELGGAKGYHRRHRVCEVHSKCPRVVVAGQERRFCQQCSRFHALSEFDQKKRSCRRRLSDHNARRRKPQADVFSFASAGLSSSLFDDTREISFVWNKAALSHVKPFSHASWPSDFKLSQVLDVGEKSTNAGGANGQIHLSKYNLSNSFPTLCHDIDELFPKKGADASGAASKIDGAPNFQRALSLLSASSRSSTNSVQQTCSLIQFTETNRNGMMSPSSNGGNSGSPFWIDGPSVAPEHQVVQFAMGTASTVFEDQERIIPECESMLFSINNIH